MILSICLFHFQTTVTGNVSSPIPAAPVAEESNPPSGNAPENEHHDVAPAAPATPAAPAAPAAQEPQLNPGRFLLPIPQRMRVQAANAVEVVELDWLQATLSLDPGPVEIPPHADVPSAAEIPLTAPRSLTDLPTSDYEIRVFRTLNRLPAHRYWQNVVRAMRRNPYSSLPAMHLHYPTPSPDVKHLQQPIGTPLPCPPQEFAWKWLDIPDSFESTGLVLGSGCFSSVFHMKTEGRQVAVKVFKVRIYVIYYKLVWLKYELKYI